MKQIVVSSIFLAIFMVFFSCGKSEKDDPSIHPSIPKIKTITRSTINATTIRTYEYDALGRIIYIKGSDRVSVHYQYQRDMIIKIDSLQQQTDTLLLNNKGLVYSVPNKWISSEYDTNGYLFRSISSSPSGAIGLVYDYKISDGNVTTREIWAFQKLSDSSDYTFLSNSINTIGNENLGVNFYGKQDKNLVSQCMVTKHSTGEKVTINYRYEMDALNRVTKKYTDSPTEDVTETFTYYD